MAATLVVGTNTYATLAEAETYMLTRLNVSVWDAASDDNKNRALIMAANKMQDMPWVGNKYLSTQTLAWPRSNTGLETVTESVVPDDIKNTQAEFALAFLTNDVTAVRTNSSLPIRKKVGQLEIEYSDVHTQESYFKYVYDYASLYLSSFTSVTRG